MIVSDKDNAEKDLDDFIKEKWNKAEENKQIMNKLLKNYEDSLQNISSEPNSIS